LAASVAFEEVLVTEDAAVVEMLASASIEVSEPVAIEDVG
jgi:hypothetical protein